jgi:hypothetical protein
VAPKSDQPQLLEYQASDPIEPFPTRDLVILAVKRAALALLFLVLIFVTFLGFVFLVFGGFHS